MSLLSRNNLLEPVEIENTAISAIVNQHNVILLKYILLVQYRHAYILHMLHCQSCQLLQLPLIPGHCHSPLSSSASAERCGTSGCQEEEMVSPRPFMTIFTGFWFYNVWTSWFAYWSTSVFTSSPLRTSCRWLVHFRQYLYVATCARQVRVT